MGVRYDRNAIAKRLVPLHLTNAYRIIHRRRRHQPLAVTPSPSRFSDTVLEFAVLYVADTARCCLWEALVRNRFVGRQNRILPRAVLDNRLLVTIDSRVPINVLDLRGDGPARIKVSTATTHDSNHRAGQALSSWLYRHMPEVDGIVYQSRFTGDSCLAIYDRACRDLSANTISEAAKHGDVLDALSEYEIKVTKPVV